MACRDTAQGHLVKAVRLHGIFPELNPGFSRMDSEFLTGAAVWQIGLKRPKLAYTASPRLVL